MHWTQTRKGRKTMAAAQKARWEKHKANGHSNGTAEQAEDELVLMASVLKNYERLPAHAKQYVINRISR